MEIRKTVIWLALVGVVVGGWSTAGQAISTNVVISQVQIAGTEFVELYNPRDTAVTLTGWYWCYFSSTKGTWDDPWRKKEFPPGARIPAHGFYLIQIYGTLPVEPDWSIGYKDGQLSDKNGTVAIFTGPPSKETLVDAVGWGNVTLAEGNPASVVPGNGQSIARKFVLEDFAKCQDTNNNAADFILQEISTPRSSRKAVAVHMAPEKQVGKPGEPIEFEVTVANKGLEKVSVSLKIGDALGKSMRAFGWDLTLTPEALVIPVGGSARVTLSTVVPRLEFFALDLETTGLDPTTNEIIEVAWVHFQGGQVVDQFSSLVRPQRPLPQRITELTGITQEMLASAPALEDVLPNVLATLSGKMVVAHNVPFDQSFIEAASSRLSLASPPIQWVDTLAIARAAWPKLKNYSLDSLCEWLGLPKAPEHRAKPHAKAAGLVLLSALARNRITLKVVSEDAQVVLAVAVADVEVR